MSDSPEGPLIESQESIFSHRNIKIASSRNELLAVGSTEHTHAEILEYKTMKWRRVRSIEGWYRTVALFDIVFYQSSYYLFYGLGPDYTFLDIGTY